MTNFHLALTRYRLHVVSHRNFSALHYHVSGIASSAIKPAPIYVPRAVCVCNLQSVAADTHNFGL